MTIPKSKSKEDDWGYFTFRASLQVRHPRRDTVVFKSIIGRAPDGAWRVGEPRKTPTGAPLEGTYKQSYCYFRLGEGDGDDLDATLRTTLQRLARHRRQVLAWRRSGGSLAFYVTLHGRKSGVGVVAAHVFSPELLSEIGRLGVELGLEVFGKQKALEK